MLLFIENIQKFNTGIISALKRNKLCSFCVAPHLRRAVVIGRSTAHTDCCPTKGVYEAAGRTLFPCFQCCGSNLCREKLQQLVILCNIRAFGSGYGFHILFVRRKF